MSTRSALSAPRLALVAAFLACAAASGAAAQVCDASRHTLWAGQHIDAGGIVISADDDNIYVWYQAGGDWKITETHLAIGDDVADIPQSKKGNPIPGRFEYSTVHQPGVSEFIYVVPRGGFGDFEEIAVAAHAVVTSPTQGTETAWAGENEFPGANWATYFTYELCGVILE
jgi:hypothetical protein